MEDHHPEQLFHLPSSCHIAGYSAVAQAAARASCAQALCSAAGQLLFWQDSGRSARPCWVKRATRTVPLQASVSFSVQRSLTLGDHYSKTGSTH